MAHRKILLVEDNPLTRKMMRFALQGEGYEVIEAGDGKTALELAASQKPDLVLQDYVLPDMDGLRLLDGLRALPGGSTLPVLVVTGMVSQIDVLREHSGSATTFLPKPIEPSRLVEIVRTHLAGTPSALGQGRRVLVVDDEPLNRKLASLRLRDAGFEVETADGGVEALEMALRSPPVAILSDVLMPGMDGFKFSEAVRGDPRLARIPVVLLSSAFVDEADARLARAMGASALLRRTPDLQEAMQVLVEKLGTPEPRAVASNPSDVARLHGQRILIQLEKQVARNDALVRQGAIQAAALSVVRGLAEAMARPHELASLLGDILVHCLDAAGLSTGVLYLIGPGGLRVQAQAGLTAEAREEAAACFGQRMALEGILAGGEPVSWSSETGNSGAPGLSDVAGLLGQSSLLVIPFVVGAERLGVLVLASGSQDLSEPAWMGFARALAVQFSQTIALGQSLSRGAASETRYRTLMEHANDAILLLDPSFVIVEANRQAEVLLGRPRDQIVGNPYGDLLVPEEREELEAVRLRLKVESGGPSEYRHLLRGDGQRVAVDVSSALVRLGEEDLILTIIRDVTARKRAEEDLARVQERLRHVVSSSPAVTYAMRVEGDRFVPTWMSANLESLLGYTPDEALAPGWWLEHLHPDDRAQALADSAALFVYGRMVSEWRFARRDGTYCWLRDERRLLRDPVGDPAEVVGSWSDVSLRKEAELQLRQSEEEYRLLFDRHPRPMWVFDPETLAFLDVNQAAIDHYGYSREEFLHMSTKDIRPRTAVTAFMERVRSEPWDPDRRAPRSAGEWLHLKKDGTEIIVEGWSSPIVFKGRQAWLVLAHDVTEKKGLEAQLLQAQKMEAIGQLAGGVAHDFNNLLGVITGYSELLLKDLGAAHPGVKRIEQIRRAADRAAGLTRQLLAFSRKQVLEPQALDLNAVVTEIEKMLRRLIGEDLVLATRLDSGLWRVRADPGQIEQVIVNLAVNARDAMPKGGQLILETANVTLDQSLERTRPDVKAGDFVMLVVADRGQGMSAETMAHIFEPFFTTKAVGKGTGLGLSTVFGIVTQSGGHISVESEVGRGTTFRIYLPRIEGEAAQAATKEPEGPPLRGSETILVVEDAEALRLMACEILGAAGYQVLEAESPRAALALAAAHDAPIHLLLTDVIMPEMSGRVLADNAQKLRPELRVLYMSGYTNETIDQHGDLPSGTLLLQKPFSAEVLLRKVHAALQGSAGSGRSGRTSTASRESESGRRRPPQEKKAGRVRPKPGGSRR